MKLRAVAMMMTGLVLATEASAADVAAQVRPGSSVAVHGTAAQRVALARGSRAGSRLGEQNGIGGGESLIPLVIAGGVVAGGIILATKHDGNSSSP